MRLGLSGVFGVCATIVACSQAKLNTQPIGGDGGEGDGGQFGTKDEFLASPYNAVSLLGDPEDHIPGGAWQTHIPNPVNFIENATKDPGGGMGAEILSDQNDEICTYLVQNVDRELLQSGETFIYSVYLKEIDSPGARVTIWQIDPTIDAKRYTGVVLNYDDPAASIYPQTGGGVHLHDIQEVDDVGGGKWFRIAVALDWNPVDAASFMKVDIVPGCPVEDWVSANGSSGSWGAMLERL